MYSHVCGDCVENGNGDVVFTGTKYRGFRACKCGSRTFVSAFVDGKATCNSCKAELFLGGKPRPLKGLNYELHPSNPEGERKTDRVKFRPRNRN